MTKCHGPSVAHEHALDFVDSNSRGRGKVSGRSCNSGEDGNDGNDGVGCSCVGGSVDGGFIISPPSWLDFLLLSQAKALEDCAYSSLLSSLCY